MPVVPITLSQFFRPLSVRVSVKRNENGFQAFLSDNNLNDQGGHSFIGLGNNPELALNDLAESLSGQAIVLGEKHLLSPKLSPHSIDSLLEEFKDAENKDRVLEDLNLELIFLGAHSALNPDTKEKILDTILPFTTPNGTNTKLREASFVTCAALQRKLIIN